MKTILSLILAASIFLSTSALAGIKIVKKDIVLSSVNNYDPALYTNLITEFNTRPYGYTSEYLLSLCPAGTRILSKSFDFCTADANRTLKRDFCYSRDSDNDLLSQPVNIGKLGFATEGASDGRVFYVFDLDRTDGRQRNEVQLLTDFHPLHYIRVTLVVDSPPGVCTF